MIKNRMTSVNVIAKGLFTFNETKYRILEYCTRDVMVLTTRLIKAKPVKNDSPNK